MIILLMGSTDPAAWYASAGWGFLGVIATVVVVPIGLYQVWAQIRDRKPCRLVYGVLASAPMLTGPSSARQRVTVTFDGAIVQNPRVITLRLTHRGRKDIAPEGFVGPMRMELGTRILEVLCAETGEGYDGPIPHMVSPEATALLIGPGVIRAGQQTTWMLLTDGAAPAPVCHNRPLDVQVTQQDASQPSRPGPPMMTLLAVVGTMATVGLALGATGAAATAATATTAFLAVVVAVAAALRRLR